MDPSVRDAGGMAPADAGAVQACPLGLDRRAFWC